MGKRKTFTVVFLTILTLVGCNFVAPTARPKPRPTVLPALTVIVEPTSAPRTDLPRDENAVPRVSLEQAKAALDSGAAIFVDVRSAQAYAQEHITGAISIPLAEIETNPTGLKLEKDQWIITYCT